MDSAKILFLVLSVIGFVMLYAISMKTFSMASHDYINGTKSDVLGFLNNRISSCRSECTVKVVSSEQITPREIALLYSNATMNGNIPAGKETEVIIRKSNSGIELVPVSGVVD